MTKRPKLIYCVIGLTLAVALPSCKPKSNVVRADSYDAETIVDLMNEEEPIIPAKHQTKKQQTGSKKPVAKSPINGQWTVIEAGHKTVRQDDEMPYVIFSDAEGRFYASDGCNIINGDFEYKPNHIISFSKVISTKKMCPDNGFQKDISSVLNSGVSVKAKIEDKKRETYLYLYSNSNDHLLTLRKHNLEVINGQWEVVDIDGEEVDGSEINLFFDIPEHSVHGNTGCNFFNGIIVIEPDVASSISFSQMGVTMKYCDNAEIERMLLVALEETETYTLQSNDKLIFHDADGKPLITLKRMQQ